MAMKPGTKVALATVGTGVGVGGLVYFIKRAKAAEKESARLQREAEGAQRRALMAQEEGRRAAAAASAASAQAAREGAARQAAEQAAAASAAAAQQAAAAATAERDAARRAALQAEADRKAREAAALAAEASARAAAEQRARDAAVREAAARDAAARARQAEAEASARAAAEAEARRRVEAQAAAEEAARQRAIAKAQAAEEEARKAREAAAKAEAERQAAERKQAEARTAAEAEAARQERARKEREAERTRQEAIAKGEAARQTATEAQTAATEEAALLEQKREFVADAFLKLLAQVKAANPTYTHQRAVDAAAAVMKKWNVVLSKPDPSQAFWQLPISEIQARINRAFTAYAEHLRKRGEPVKPAPTVTTQQEQAKALITQAAEAVVRYGRQRGASDADIRSAVEKEFYRVLLIRPGGTGQEPPMTNLQLLATPLPNLRDKIRVAMIAGEQAIDVKAMTPTQYNTKWQGKPAASASTLIRSTPLAGGAAYFGRPTLQIL